MAEHDQDFELARLEEQIEPPAGSLDAPARHLVEDLQRMYQMPSADLRANAESLRRVQRRLQARLEHTHQETPVAPLVLFQRREERTPLMQQEASVRKPIWGRLAQTLSTVAAVLVVVLLVGSIVALVNLKGHASKVPNTNTGSATTPAPKLDCSHVFMNPDLSANRADNGEHVVCLQNLETPLHGTTTVNGHKVTLISAYADANRLLIKFAVDGHNGSKTQGGILLTYLTIQGGTQLSPTSSGGGYYYDQQHQQTAYLDSFDTESVPASTASLQVSALFLAITSFSGSGSGDSASLDFTVPIQAAKHIVSLNQSAVINGHRLTLTNLRVTPSMTVLRLKSDQPLPASYSFALLATLNGSATTDISLDPPDTGKYDPIQGFIVSAPEDFLARAPSAWTLSLDSSGAPLGVGKADIQFTA